MRWYNVKIEYKTYGSSNRYILILYSLYNRSEISCNLILKYKKNFVNLNKHCGYNLDNFGKTFGKSIIWRNNLVRLKHHNYQKILLKNTTPKIHLKYTTGKHQIHINLGHHQIISQPCCIARPRYVQKLPHIWHSNHTVGRMANATRIKFHTHTNNALMLGA